ncbi:MAG: response regulator [Acidobacteria bacterium]|nr:response regulator [Acidobacteriota bacterium]
MATRDRVLVVDDEPSLRRLYRVELEQAGFEVSVAASAEEALVQVQGERPAVVVMDIRMPGMDGLELMSRILALEPGTHVVLNSAYGSYRDLFSSWAADAYVIKSSDVLPLVREVERLARPARRRGAA